MSLFLCLLNQKLQFIITIFTAACLLCYTIMIYPFIIIEGRCVDCKVPVKLDKLRLVVNEILNNGSTDQKAVNPPIAEYIHSPSNICDETVNHGPELMLILVKSDASNIAQRMVIRQTWGNISHSDIKVIYLLGFYSVVQEMIDLEAKLYKDVLQGEFVDIYNNNMNKTAMAYKWAVENCINTQYLFFVDDDFFINVVNVVQYLKSRSAHSNLFLGHVIRNAKPFRNKSSKWYITPEEYPYHIYPSYLSGGAILVSMDIAKLLKTALPYVRYIHIDDCYLGIVAQKLNITPQHDNRIDVIYTSPMHLKDIFASHAYGDHKQLLVLWEVYLATRNLTSSEDINKLITSLIR